MFKSNGNPPVAVGVLGGAGPAGPVPLQPLAGAGPVPVEPNVKGKPPTFCFSLSICEDLSSVASLFSTAGT